MPADTAAAPTFRAEGVARTFRWGDAEVRALAGLDLEVAPGELVVVAGPSGSGKSTLLHLLGALDEPDGGRVLFAGRDLAAMSERERTLLRRRRLGFVFQSFHLVPVLSALENVEYPLAIDGVAPRERRRRAAAALDQVGLAARATHRPDRLSGGERQRVAIARALVHGPAAVLADEPTGNLDSANAERVFGLLAALGREHGATVVIATHDPALVARAPRVVTLHDGRVAGDTRRPGAA